MIFQVWAGPTPIEGEGEKVRAPMAPWAAEAAVSRWAKANPAAWPDGEHEVYVCGEFVDQVIRVRVSRELRVEAM